MNNREQELEQFAKNCLKEKFDSTTEFSTIITILDDCYQLGFNDLLASFKEELEQNDGTIFSMWQIHLQAELKELRGNDEYESARDEEMFNV
mgnify:CR=1 FL=1